MRRLAAALETAALTIGLAALGLLIYAALRDLDLDEPARPAEREELD